MTLTLTRFKNSLYYYRLNCAYEVRRAAQRLRLWFIWKLPTALVYWCVIRAMAHATTGAYSNQLVPDLTAMDTLERWAKDYRWKK